MTFLALNLLLALVWMFLTGSFGIFGLLVGFVFGYLVLFLGRPFLGCGGYIRAVRGTLVLVAVFLYELVVANIQLARDILRPHPNLKPGFLRFHVPELSPAQAVLLGNMISLTPGTLTVDNDEESNTLYIHSIYAHNPEQARESLRLFVRLIRGAAGLERDPQAEGGVEG